MSGALGVDGRIGCCIGCNGCCMGCCNGCCMGCCIWGCDQACGGAAYGGCCIGGCGGGGSIDTDGSCGCDCECIDRDIDCDDDRASYTSLGDDTSDGIGCDIDAGAGGSEAGRRAMVTGVGTACSKGPGCTGRPPGVAIGLRLCTVPGTQLLLRLCLLLHI